MARVYRGPPAPVDSVGSELQDIGDNVAHGSVAPNPGDRTMAISIFEKGDVDVQAQKAAESALRAKRRDRDNLAERLGISEVAVVSHRAKARELARDGGDDAAITKAEGKMRDAQDRVVTLSGAIGDVDKIIAGLEAQVEAIIDRRCRVA